MAKRITKLVSAINWKTLYLNFKYFPFRDAIKFPILVDRHLRIRTASGRISITGPIKTAMIRIGFDSVGIFDNKKSRSIWEVNGSLIFEGFASIGHGSKICVLRGGGS